MLIYYVVIYYAGDTAPRRGGLDKLMPTESEKKVFGESLTRALRERPPRKESTVLRLMTVKCIVCGPLP